MSSNQYESARIAVDAVALRYNEQSLEVFLNRREKSPYKNRRELPGGLLAKGETAEETLRRKVLSPVPGLDKSYLQQFHTFTAPKRDPRERTISIGYMALTASTDEENSEEWYSVMELPELAFDHEEIIESALAFLAEQEISLLRHLLPRHFRLNALHHLAECAFQQEYDNRNFRRMVLSPEIVVPTEKLSREGAHRPARLYKFR